VEARDIPIIYLVNKLDQMDELACERIKQELPLALLVSSRDALDVARIHRTIGEFFANRLSEAELRVPFHHAALRAEILAEARVLSETFDETGGLIHLRADDAALARWRARLEQTS